jgi:hypothetical protein
LLAAFVVVTVIFPFVRHVMPLMLHDNILRCAGFLWFPDDQAALTCGTFFRNAGISAAAIALLNR